MFIKDLILKIENEEFGEILPTLCYSDLAHQKNRYLELLNTAMSNGLNDVIIVSASGRTEVSGNHTDHQLGHVLAGSVNMDMIAVVEKCDSVQVVSQGRVLNEIKVDDLAIHPEEKESSEALIRGTLARFKELGFNIGGFKAYVHSDVLVGSGISSSAAFEDLIGAILNYLYNDGNIDNQTIARVAQFAENKYFMKACGLMDQMACACGGLITIDFKNNVVNEIPLDLSSKGYALCLVDTKGSHEGLTAEYEAMPFEMKRVAAYFDKPYCSDITKEMVLENLAEIRKVAGDRAVLRAFHYFDEDKRVVEAVKALKEDRFNDFLGLVKASGESSYKYLQNVYTAKDPRFEEIAVGLYLTENFLNGEGAFRVHGGGLAGTIQAYIPLNRVNEYKECVEKVFGAGSCHIMTIRPYGVVRVF